MLKKYKILTALIVLIWLGIVVVISIWLYGIYKTKQEALVSDVERSLFNTVQSYLQSEERIKENNSRPFDRDGTVFITEVHKYYPNVDQQKLKTVWDSLRNERKGYWSKRFKGREKGRTPFFMLQNLDFGESDRAEIAAQLDTSLKVKGMIAKVNVNMVTVDDDTVGVGRRRYEVMPDGDIQTRPILINPDENLLLFATIKRPFIDVIWRMALQATMSAILILALIAIFGYLLYTINRQNKMAVLRKSFVNNMTHELKTPVATVMAAIEAVQRYGARDDKEKMARYLAISHRELEHLSRLIERVLQLDMDGVHNLVLDKVKFDLTLLMQQCIDTARLSCPKQISIDLIADNPISYFGDRSHIKNIFSNLLDNAIKYSLEEVNIIVHIQETGDKITVTVKDHGLGIAEKYKNDIFDMFFRVPAGNLHPVKGFGLGLSYVKLIVDKHGGSITVQSKPGAGSTFKITLPKLSI